MFYGFFVFWNASEWIIFIVKYAKNHKRIKIPFSEGNWIIFVVTIGIVHSTRWTEAYKHSKSDIKYTNGITDTEKLFDTRKWKSIWSSVSVAVARRHFLSLLFWWQQWIRWIIKSNVELCSAKCEMQLFFCCCCWLCPCLCYILWRAIVSIQTSSGCNEP